MDEPTGSPDLSTIPSMPIRHSKVRLVSEHLEKLRAEGDNLKRKASQVSVSRGDNSAAEDWVNAHLDFIEKELEICKASEDYIWQEFEEGHQDQSSLRNFMETSTNKRAKLTSTKLMLGKDGSNILLTLQREANTKERPTQTLEFMIETLQYRWNSYEPEDKSSSKEQTHWKNQLIMFYNAADPEYPDEIWCPITRTWGPRKHRIASHIVPHVIGERNCILLFGCEKPDSSLRRVRRPGEPSGNRKKYQNLWDYRNGILMSDMAEYHFYRGNFVILPRFDVNGEIIPKTFYIRVINTAAAIIDQVMVSGKNKVTLGDLDGKDLVFEPGSSDPTAFDFRPALRFLYVHYAMSLIRARRHNKPGWMEAVKTKTGIWATPSPYLRQTMLRKLAECIDHLPTEDVDRLFPENITGDGEMQSNSEEEDISAMEIFVVMEKRRDPGIFSTKALQNALGKENEAPADSESESDEDAT